MSRPPHRVVPAWHYGRAEEVALELEQLLNEHGVRLEPGSPFETHVLDVMRFVHERRTRDPNYDRDYRKAYRTLIGVHALASAILSVRGHSSFGALLPHLRLLNSGAALQNTPSVATDSATNKLFELFAACMAMRCGEDIELDDPYNARGDNPDVLATIDGRRWGIACKVLHGTNPEGFVGHLEKGIEQIEASPAELGVVLFNLKNILPHDEIWPFRVDEGPPRIEGPVVWHDPADPFNILVEQLDKLGDDLVQRLPGGYLDQLFRSKKSIPGFLLWADSVTAVRQATGAGVAGVRALNFRHLADIPPTVDSVLKCLGHAVTRGNIELMPDVDGSK